jgi:large subunit ribosomal protein L15
LPLYRRIPKLKHFPIVNQKKFTIINVGKLSDLPPQTAVTLASLLEAGVLTTNDGPLKILGDGEIAVTLAVSAAAFTRSAREKIEAAGGSCTVTA